MTRSVPAVYRVRPWAGAEPTLDAAAHRGRDLAACLAVVAHPDDLEFGAAVVIARWTDAGKHVVSCLLTRDEAGIDGIAPRRAATTGGPSSAPPPGRWMSTPSRSPACPTAFWSTA